MRQVLQGVWERTRAAIAAGVSSLGGLWRPRSRAGRPARNGRERGRDPLARGIVASLLSHRERFDCGRCEQAWEDWSSGRGSAVDCSEAQLVAMADLQEVLDRNRLRGRLEPLWPPRGDEIVPCVFLPRGIERGTKWRELRNLAWETRWWPVEVDDLGALVGDCEQAGPECSPDDVLDEAERLEVVAPQGERPVLLTVPSLEEKAPSPPPRATLRFLDDPGADPVPGNFLVLVPTSRPWEIPAHLFFDGWKDWPRGAVHVAWWKRWFELHGAEIRTISGHHVDLYVPRCPADDEEARRVLEEHARYSPLSLGTGEVAEQRALARVMRRHSWTFWWE